MQMCIRGTESILTPSHTLPKRSSESGLGMKLRPMQCLWVSFNFISTTESKTLERLCVSCVELLICYQSPGQTLYKILCKHEFDFRIKKTRARRLSYIVNHKSVRYIKMASVRLLRLIMMFNQFHIN